MEKWRDRDNLQRERKRRWNRGRERESERWRDKRRQREGTGETGQWLPLVPTPGSHSRRALASSVCRFRSAHPGSLGSGSGPPSCRPDTSCQSGLGWHAGRNLPRSLTWFFYLSAPQSHLINADQELPRWGEGPGLMAMPVEAFLPMTVKLLGPLFFIYITDARVLWRPPPNESQLPPNLIHRAFCFTSDGLLTFNSNLPSALTGCRA